MVTISIILMTVIGAMFGALMRDEYLSRKKRSLELESKTPYDYALANARADNKRYRNELVTIKALKRTEADTERIRNEIDTILSDDGEEATEGTYEANIGMPVQDNGDGTFSPITWDNRISSGEMVDNISKAVARVHGTNAREFEHVVTPGETLTTIARKYGVKIWDIVEDNDILIYDSLDEIGVVRVGERLKIRGNVREFEHVVTSGETLSTICYKYKRMPSKLLEYNKLESLQNIHVGQVLIIPEED